MPMPVRVQPTEIPEVLAFATGLIRDARGFFSELYSRQTFSEQGFTAEFVQDNCSLSGYGVLRGMHYQIEPNGMGKLIQVIQGSIFDVAVDIRRGSPTFGQWVGQVLSAENRVALWVPVGFAHGFLSLEDDTLVFYKCTTIHAPQAERAFRYNDPAVGIDWPFEPKLVSRKDAEAPLLAEADYNFEWQG